MKTRIVAEAHQGFSFVTVFGGGVRFGADGDASTLVIELGLEFVFTRGALLGFEPKLVYRFEGFFEGGDIEFAPSGFVR